MKTAEQLDGASAKARFRIAVYGLIIEEGRVVLCRRRDSGWWNLPGGGMELGETPEEALMREVREETGLEVEVGRLVGVYSKPQKQELVLAFACRVVGGMLMQETEEVTESRYVLPDALPEPTLPKHAERVRDAFLNQPAAIMRAQRSSTEEDQRRA
jgi:ADP-ribose pyrophosphatase YjhB (NUDIX family)